MVDPVKTGLEFGLALLLLVSAGCARNADEVELLNVSYDPTRELWQELNEAFAKEYQAKHGQPIRLEQSHGGSSSQARAVVDGLGADVVTLALWSDTEALRRKGLIAEGWEERLPDHSLPYYSTIVFVVRKGNPKQIRDWPDLIREGVAVITPNPKTSGNGRLSFLAAWGAVRDRGGSESEAEEYVRRLYRNVKVLDTGARGSTVTFAMRKVGDVQITWENEARLEVLESSDKLEIVYPSRSIKAEPHVAWVDKNVEKRGTREAAEEYLRFLYTAEAQEIIARNDYRPIDAEILKRHAERFPAIKLFPITAFVTGWEEAQTKFFNDQAIFDRIYER
jgi:sulfate transport system substrate-binding protein